MHWTLHLKAVRLHPIATRLVSPFETSFGIQHERPAILVEVESQTGAIGWGEVVAGWEPGYSYETIHTAQHILRDFLIPRLLAQPHLDSTSRWDWLHSVRGHPLAKHGLLGAIFTVVAAEQQLPLADLLQRMAGAESRKSRVEVGVSIGIQPSIEASLASVQQHLDSGYRRIKLKIKPGWDVAMLGAVRAAFPDLVMMADANSAYRLADARLLRELDALGLLMIEQPLAHDDIFEHHSLQAQLETPICLDESIESLGDATLAHQLQACRIINLKPQRVGGLFEALKIHAFCQQQGIPLWVGGMLETGVGRAISLALAALPGVTLPCDLSASSRYYKPDIADPPFELGPDSTLAVPDAPGLGVQVDPARLAAAKLRFTQVEKALFG